MHPVRQSVLQDEILSEGDADINVHDSMGVVTLQRGMDEGLGGRKKEEEI